MEPAPTAAERSKRNELRFAKQLVIAAAPVLASADTEDAARRTARRQVAWAFRAAETHDFTSELREFAAARGLSAHP